MDIKAVRSSMAALQAQMAQVGGDKQASGVKGADFVSSLDAALKSVSQSQSKSADLQKQFQLENPAVSLEETMIAMNKASISFSAAVQVRNRLVQAYEQIMNMPV